MEEENKEVVTVGEGILTLINSQTELYFNTVDDDPKTANTYIRNIISLCDKYKTLYEVDQKYYATDKDNETKITIAKLEAENRLAVANMETKLRVDLAEIDAKLKETISRIDNEAKMSICDAENQTRVNIANADIELRKKEYILNIANAGLNVATKAVGAGLAYTLVKEAFIAECNNAIIGKATGTRMADKIGMDFLKRLILF